MAPTSSVASAPPTVLLKTPSSAAGVERAPEAADFDEIFDLTDRRRVLLRTVFGCSMPADAVDAVFAPAQPPEPVTPLR